MTHPTNILAGPPCRAHQICFRPRLRPGPRWGSLQLFPMPLAGLRGPNSKGEGEGEGEGKGKGRGEEGREEEGRGWKVPAPFRKFLNPPLPPFLGHRGLRSTSLSVIFRRHGYQLSTTELSQSPLHVSGTNYRVTSTVPPPTLAPRWFSTVV